MTRFALRRLAAIYAGGVLGALARVGLARLAAAGHSHLVWLNIGLSLLAGFAAVALGNWLGGLF